MFVEKRNMSTVHMICLLAKHFGVNEEAVGYAGLKDKRAVTRQLVSIQTPGKKPTDFPAFEHERVKVLWTDLHTNKLRQGHLAGTGLSCGSAGRRRRRRFTRTRCCSGSRLWVCRTRAGEQRFGHMGNNHLIARHWVRGEYQEAVDELLGRRSSGRRRRTSRGGCMQRGSTTKRWRRSRGARRRSGACCGR